MSTSVDGAKWKRRDGFHSGKRRCGSVLPYCPGANAMRCGCFTPSPPTVCEPRESCPMGTESRRVAPGGDVKLVKSTTAVTLDVAALIRAERRRHRAQGDCQPGGCSPSDGNWVLPYCERAPPEAAKIQTHRARGCFGEHRRRRIVEGKGADTCRRTWLIEGTAVERSDGSIACLFRTSKGKLYQSTRTTARGCQPHVGANPDSKVNAITLTTGS